MCLFSVIYFRIILSYLWWSMFQESLNEATDPLPFFGPRTCNLRTWPKSQFCWVVKKLSELGLLQSVDVKAKLQGRPKLQAEVLHDHVALKEQQSVPINLLREADVYIKNNQVKFVLLTQQFKETRKLLTHMFSKDIWVRTKSLRVSIPDEPNHILDRPGGWVLIGWSLGLQGLWRNIIASWKNKKY